MMDASYGAPRPGPLRAPVGALTCSSASARAAWGEALHDFLAHRKRCGAALERALGEDPGLVPALVLRGFALRLLGRRDLAREAAAALRQAELSLEARGGAPREELLVDALRAHCAGDPFEAVRALEQVLDRDPRDRFAIKLAHALRFVVGDVPGMRRSLERVLPAWGERDVGYGFVLGCYAFALEQSGETEAAERVGRRAVELEPGDAWGAHAVAHVMETSGRAREGVAWLRATEARCEGLGNFGGHVAWHRALFHVELGEDALALATYDELVEPWLGRDYRDVANASTLLHRLRSLGVDVGRRWHRLAAIAEERAGDHGLAFADLHYVLVLLEVGDLPGARRFVASMREAARTGEDHAALVASAVGVPFAEAMLHASSGEAGSAARRMAALRPELFRLGGSRAQRDILLLLTIEAALEGHEPDLARALIAERRAQRPSDRWAAHALSSVDMKTCPR